MPKKVKLSRKDSETIDRITKRLLGEEEEELTYSRLDAAYRSAMIGSSEPNVGLTNPITLERLKERFTHLQRFTETNSVGITGLRFHRAILTPDDSVPENEVVWKFK